jgi:hypothetical protein
LLVQNGEHRLRNASETDETVTASSLFPKRQIFSSKAGANSPKNETDHGPYLEIFARRPRPGWTTWGDELPPPRTASVSAAQVDLEEAIAVTTTE